MKVAVHNHQNKAGALAAALAEHGHELVSGPPADVLLIDLDVPRPPYKQWIEMHAAHGARVVLYPHGGTPMTLYDSIVPVCPLVHANLVTGEGHAEVMRRFGYPVPVHPIGWSLCELLPFRPVERPRRLLFAPLHPNGNGHLHELGRDLNRGVYEQLLALPGVELTVRHVGALDQNGLWPVDGVAYSRAQMDSTWADIDGADAVVTAAGTFPFLSVARGRPTLVYGQDVPPNYGEPGERLVRPRHWDAYADYMRYPLDLGCAPLPELLAEAARSDEPIAEWRRLFLGPRFDPARFAGQLQQIVAAPAPEAPALPRFSVMAWAAEVAERPELLRSYAGSFDAADDATLVLYAPGGEEQSVLAAVRAAIERGGLREDALPDVALMPVPLSEDGERTLARRSHAVLSDSGAPAPFDTLPRFDSSRAPVLRALAESHWEAHRLWAA